MPACDCSTLTQGCALKSPRCSDPSTAKLPIDLIKPDSSESGPKPEVQQMAKVSKICRVLWVRDCQGATPTSDKARRPTPTTGDRGRRWRLIGKEGPASKVLSGTYENVAEVGTGRVALSMQRLRQGGILRNDFNDFKDFNDFNLNR